MNTPTKCLKTIEITPEEFYLKIPKSLVPKKALKGDIYFYFIPELETYFVFNESQNKHYIFK
jgi:hypothetical protein